MCLSSMRKPCPRFIINVPTRYPKFEDWDGSPNTMASWINNASNLKRVHGTKDAVAIKFARLKLAMWIQNRYSLTDPKDTLEEFTQKFHPLNWAISGQLA